MTSETDYAQNSKTSKILIVLVLLATCVYGNTFARDERNITEHEFYLLQHYKLIYTEEIFDFCVDKHGTTGTALGSCMIKQSKLKKMIFNVAHRQLGRRSLVQKVYDECADYYPVVGVARINQCVRTRLMLDTKLENDAIETIIYDNCESKWRKHGASAINNCAVHEANHYREKGRLQED